MPREAVGEVLLHCLDDLDQLGGQGAAVGVAQHQALGPAVQGGLQGLQGVVPVFLEAVEEVLGVVEQLLHPGLEIAQGVVMSSRLRSGVVWRISLTWKSEDLPKMVTTGARLRRSSWKIGSDSGGRSL